MSRKQDSSGAFVDTKTGKESQFKYSAPSAAPSDDSFSWGNVDSVFLQRAIDAVTERGHSISFAVNYNRTAGSITILAGPDRPKWTGLTESAAEEVLKTLV